MSPSTTARPEVMYSNAKPFALARSTTQPLESSIGSSGSPARTTSAPERRRQKRGPGGGDAEAGAGGPLHEDPPALGAVGEGLADRAVDAPALRVLALQDRHG